MLKSKFTVISRALSRAKRAQRSTIGKKIWLSMHPRSFGSDNIVRTEYVHTFTPSCKPDWNFAFQVPARFGVNRIATHIFREKATTTKPILSFDLIVMTRKLQMNPSVGSLSSTLRPSSWCFLSTKGEQKVRFWCFIYYSIITCEAFNLTLSVTTQAKPSVLVVFSSRPYVLVTAVVISWHF